MRWPWQRKSSKDQLIVSWSAGTFAYVKAPINSDGLYAVQQMGVEHQGADSMEGFVRRLQALGLKGMAVHVMLRPEQYQLLQIDAPPVAPEELRAAARFQIREMVNVHIDDITLDVMQVGDGQQKGPNHLFVVAAKNEVMRQVISLGDALNWTVPVIDIQETAQRNLQSALAKRDGRLERADAALLISDERQAVLTISANEELFFTRRLDLPQEFLTMPWGVGQEAAADATPDMCPTTQGAAQWARLHLPAWETLNGFSVLLWRCSALWTCGTVRGPACHWVVCVCMPVNARLSWPAG
jgi:MSHA biogenesis protein MshI